MFIKIVFCQARQKWVVTLLLLLAMTSLVTLYVYLKNTTRFSNRSMQLIVKNMGHNLIFMPDSADPLDAFLVTDRQVDFPANTIRRLAKHRRLASKYYVSVLQQRIHVNGRGCVLTGIEPVERGDETPEKRNMIRPVKQGEARIGFGVSQVLALKRGGAIEILGQAFTVSEVLPAKGTLDDYRIYIPLDQCQVLLNKEEKINLGLGFLCMHGLSLSDVLEFQDSALKKVLPGFKQVTKMDMARGRFLARMTTARSLYYLLTIILAITVLIIVITGLQEVTERKQEAGILVSMGAGYGYLTGLYVTKILFIALASAITGFLTGSWLAVLFTSEFLVINTNPVTVLWKDLPHIIGLTCLVALAGEGIPMVKLVRMDPSRILMEE